MCVDAKPVTGETEHHMGNNHFQWHIHSVILVSKITGIGQLLSKLLVGWYTFLAIDMAWFSCNSCLMKLHIID